MKEPHRKGEATPFWPRVLPVVPRGSTAKRRQRYWRAGRLSSENMQTECRKECVDRIPIATKLLVPSFPPSFSGLQDQFASARLPAGCPIRPAGVAEVVQTSPFLFAYDRSGFHFSSFCILRTERFFHSEPLAPVYASDGVTRCERIGFIHIRESHYSVHHSPELWRGQTERYPCFNNHINLVNILSVPPRVLSLSWKKISSLHLDQWPKRRIVGVERLKGSNERHRLGMFFENKRWNSCRD
jgi:hypothetical protein